MPQLYPAKRAAVDDEDGNAITGAGVSVATMTPYYAKLLRSGKLRTTDPYQLSECPIGTWLEARACSVTGRKVTALVDLTDSTHLLEQATEAAQCDAPEADDALSGAESLTFSNAQYYISNRAASAWKHLHDGTGCDVIITYVVTTTATGTRTFLSTHHQSNFATEVGMWFGLTVSGGQRQTVRVAAANASRVLNVEDKTFGGVAGTPRISRMRYKEGASPECVNAVGRVTLATSASSIAPSSADPLQTLCLGGNNAGSTFLAEYRFHSLFISEPGETFSEIDIARIYAYLEDQTGIERPRSSVATGKRRALVIALGESLIVGQANTSSFPNSYPPVNGRVKKYDDSGRWLELSEPNDDPGPASLYPGISDPVGNYGTGYVSMFCSDLQNLLDSEAEIYEVGLVPCGRSSTRSWDWAIDDTLWAEAKEKIRRALELPNSEVCAIVLDQGVNDCGATVDPDGMTWTQRWNAAIGDLRTEFADRIGDDVPLFYRQLPATVSSTYDATKWANLRTEEAAWEDLATQPYRVMMTGADDPSYYVGPGNPHYNVPGCKAQAALLYAKYLLYPGPQGDGPEAAVLSGFRGLSGFDASTVLGVEIGEGVQGNNSDGVTVMVLVRLDEIPTTLQSLIECVFNNYGYQVRSNLNQMQWIAGNGVTSVAATSRLWVATDVGKHHLIVLSCDTTQVTSYFNGTLLGSTALAGYEPPVSEQMVTGSTDGGQRYAESFTWRAAAGRASSITLAEVQTIWAATKEAGELDLGGVTMDHFWKMPLVSSVPSTITDEAGSDDLTFQQGVTANLVLEEFEEEDIAWGGA